MKETIEIVRKAMKIKNSKKQDAYMGGQLQVLEHVLSENKSLDELAHDLMNVYSTAIGYCTNWKNKKGQNDQEQEMCGAADIIAWLADFPEKDHELNKTMGKIQPK